MYRDEALPLVRNAHVPAMHAERNHLVCLTCAMITRSESVRGFDRHRCGLATGHLLRDPSASVRNRDRVVTYEATRDAKGLPKAKCQRCFFELQWQFIDVKPRVGLPNFCTHAQGAEPRENTCQSCRGALCSA